ncbi:hypothetical protein HZA40_04730, partial [Candidatus Peregrinibacteria bacterium]|nr:hypothetical protein [Candidatus Peregrinibacteria bacterium]
MEKFEKNQSRIGQSIVISPSEKIILSNSTNLTCLTDQNLYELCKTYGTRALEWRRKFIGLLPEVNKRKLYQKKGFGSIFEFAKKLAGLSEEQVRLA